MVLAELQTIFTYYLNTTQKRRDCRINYGSPAVLNF